MDKLQLATTFMLQSLKGKYITYSHLKPELEKLNSDFKIQEIGQSVKGESIYSVEFGTGTKKVLMWSQMHGNEPTTTKGLMDFLHFLNSSHKIASEIKQNYTLLCIPILNPDGAKAYTRANANNIDLNRDAYTITQPESIVLRNILKSFQPDLCFNLHDQRTIFGTEGFQLPATMSFLAPAYDEQRNYNTVRLKAIQYINAINSKLQEYIPNQVGRFDDSFNINCIGDYVTSIGIPTILFEAGHYKDDYNREEVRKFVFIAILEAIIEVSENDIENKELSDYLNIPQNIKCFVDIIYKNVKIIDNNEEKIINFAAQYSEVLVDDIVTFEAKIFKINNLEDLKGHLEIDCEEMLFSADYGNLPIIDKKADFYLNNLLKIVNGLRNV